MRCNVGGWDRVARLVAGVLLLAAGVAFRSWWGLIGLLPLVTAAFAYCPVYLPFRMSTKREPAGRPSPER